MEASKKVKMKIEELIEIGEVENAKKLLQEYYKIGKDDFEYYSYKGIINIIETDFESAINDFKTGLLYNDSSFDLNYNLAFAYENLSEYSKAHWHYNRCTVLETSEAAKVEISNKLNDLEKNNEIDYKKYDRKIVFFVKKGMDSFLGDIVDNITKDYNALKIIVTEYSQIDLGMKWADICWFEWCDELVIYGSKLSIINEKKIICRLHSYEAFTDNISKVKWNVVDKIIFVSESIRKHVISSINVIEERNTIVIPNGIDLNKWTYRDNEDGFNIAYVGYINYKKGPMLLLHAFKAIYDADNRYKLFVAGKFQDDRDLLYFEQMIKELGLENNFFFEGWQDNLDSWLENKNYIICTSILESQNLSVMQAMAKGIKPLVHNFVGAKEIYDEKYVWNSINDLVDSIKNHQYSPNEYREYISDFYSLEMQLSKIKLCFDDIIKKDKKENYIIDFTVNDNQIYFYLPNTSDWIQKIIYSNNNFYEVEMLMDIYYRLGKNKTIVDIGANIGNHSVYFGKICEAERVFSFEPQKEIFNILKKNIELNNLVDVISPVNIGIGKELTRGNIIIPDNNNLGMGRILEKDNGSIEINSIDNLFLGKDIKIDMIKIDVEGMEIEVLKGSINILNLYKPILYIEAATEDYYNDINTFLTHLGYTAITKFNATPTYLFEVIN